MCWFACIIIIEGGAYSVFMQEKRLFDIMTHEVSTFLGEAAKVLQIQILNPGDGHNNLLQSPAIKRPATVH